MAMLSKCRVVAVPGSAFEVEVEIPADFKLYSAAGVTVHISMATPMSGSDHCHKGQFFWLDASKMNIRQKHTFRGFALWEQPGALEPSSFAPFEMPLPTGKYMYIEEMQVPTLANSKKYRCDQLTRLLPTVSRSVYLGACHERQSDQRTS